MEKSISKESKKCELSFLLRKPEEVKVITSVLERYSLRVTKYVEPKQINLPQPIKKELIAFLGVIEFDCENSQLIKSLRSDLNLEPACLRFLIVKKPIIRSSETSSLVELNQGEKGEINKSKSGGTLSLLDEITNEELERKLKEIIQ